MTSAYPVPAPHRIIKDSPAWCAALLLASLLLSLWAIHLDPVVNADGVGDLIAAQHFAAGAWRSAVETADKPVYALLVAAVSGLTGMSVGHGAYLLNAGLCALLVLGFVALVNTLGATVPGGRPAPWMATAVVLLYPALNGVRSFVTADVGYWAFYIWSLAWFLHWTSARDRRSFWMWAAYGSAALLFGLEAIVFLLIVPAWWWSRTIGRARVLRFAAVIAGIGLLVCYAVWHHTWHSGMPGPGLLRHPAHYLAAGLQDVAQGLRFKLEGLRSAFLNQFSSRYDALALLTTFAALVITALVKALGPLYAGLAVYGCFGLKRMLPAVVRYWWGVFALLAVVAMLAPAFTEFEVTRGDAMIAALTLSTAIPLGLERLRRLRMDARGELRWVLPLVLALVVLTGIKGLEPRTRHGELRAAGLWLRATAASGSALYSNNPVIDYYSGLKGYRPASGYSWQEAMRTVWSDRWRDYDYLALAIPHDKAYREGILMRDIKRRPVRVFSDQVGDRVLIFRHRH